jgi:phosphatidylinositol alpha-mannosyltransferase
VRVALACPYAWDDAGGVQVQVRELAERLHARGHEVMVLTPARRPPAEPYVVRVGRPVDIPYNASNAPIDPRPWSRGRIRDVLGAFAPDVVHAHQPTAPSTGMWATLEARAPVVGTFHSGATRARLYDLAAPLIRRVARRLAVRVAVSERAAAFERSRIGGAFEIIPNGVDTIAFARATPADLGAGTKLLFVGRLDERKGFAVAVEAFRRLAATRENLLLVVAGDGPQRDVVGRLPAGHRERVRMLGRVAHTELPAVAAACDLYLGPAIGGESFGVVLVEAMAAGLPVIASDIPGYDEVVRQGIDGLLVAPRDPAALAVAADRVLGDPALAERLVTAGRDRAATFDWEVVVERIEDAYRRALQAGSPSLR